MVQPHQSSADLEAEEKDKDNNPKKRKLEEG
jgi:hypothetical protein